MPYLVSCDGCGTAGLVPDHLMSEPGQQVKCRNPEATGCCTKDHHHGAQADACPASHEGACSVANPDCTACRSVTISAEPGSATVSRSAGPSSGPVAGITGMIAMLMLRSWLMRFMLLWFAASGATILERARQTSLLASILNGTTWPVVPAGWKMRLGSTAPTVSAAMTELTGSGYTAGGTAFTSQTVAAAATTLPVAALTWTNASGGAWSIVGLEIWDTAGTPLRWLWGLWTGQPISVANTNTFQVAINGVSADATAW